MASDDIPDGREIDSLIQELKAPPKRPVPPKPVVRQAAAQAAAQARPVVPSRVDAQASPTYRRSFVSAMNLAPLPEVNLSRGMRLPRLSHRLMSFAPGEEMAVRMWVALGVLLSVAMPYWPYPKASPWWLSLYLSAVVMVLVTGFRSARLTWVARLGYSHSVALATVLWGLILTAAEVLPRTGTIVWIH